MVWNDALEKSSREYSELAGSYDTRTEEWYAFLPEAVRDIFVNDAKYHKRRYLDLLKIPYGPRVIELGSDKPIISHYLRLLNPGSEFFTISIDIPHSPYPIIPLDIEAEEFPFADESISDIIFTEVLEHLFRNPSWTVFQMNRVLEPSGRLVLTTPNACGYDVFQNILFQRNPNERNQFYAAMESGHPHLWTAGELGQLLEVHGFQIGELSTVDYYDIPVHEEAFKCIENYSVNPSLHGQVLRVVAHKADKIAGPQYPKELFPEGKPVEYRGALKRWIERCKASPAS